MGEACAMLSERLLKAKSLSWETIWLCTHFTKRPFLPVKNEQLVGKLKQGKTQVGNDEV